MSTLKQKMLTVLLSLSFLFQTYASSSWSLTPEEEWENIVELFKIAIPVGIFVGAPLIITMIIVGSIKTAKKGVDLTGSLFKRDSED